MRNEGGGNGMKKNWSRDSLHGFNRGAVRSLNYELKTSLDYHKRRKTKRAHATERLMFH